MRELENQLLTLFSLLEWPALFQPFTFCSHMDDWAPTYYIPSIKLFVCCDDEKGVVFSRMISWGEGWRHIPGCPKPKTGDTLQIADLIEQPAAICFRANSAMMFYQFRDLPGSPANDGMLEIFQCEACNEWSPNPSYGAVICRGCGKRDDRRGAASKFFMLTFHGTEPKGLSLMNGLGECLRVPERKALYETKYAIEKLDKKPLPLPGVTFWGAFDRLLAGCSPQSKSV